MNASYPWLDEADAAAVVRRLLLAAAAVLVKADGLSDAEERAYYTGVLMLVGAFLAEPPADGSAMTPGQIQDIAIEALRKHLEAAS
jgi:hypothetical protein